MDRARTVVVNLCELIGASDRMQCALIPPALLLHEAVVSMEMRFDETSLTASSLMAISNVIMVHVSRLRHEQGLYPQRTGGFRDSWRRSPRVDFASLPNSRSASGRRRFLSWRGSGGAGGV